MQHTETMNTRILVVDDEEAIRDGFRLILGPPSETNASLEAAASLLFDEAPPLLSKRRQVIFDFDVDVASNGTEGIARVRDAVDSNRPYAVIFCDIRMPGIDGVETIEQVRRIDSKAEVVFITAYSEHSIETIVERAGADVSYFIKPFVTDEARQLATKLVLDWNKARELERLMQAVSSLRGEAEDIERILQHLLGQTCTWLETNSAALFRRLPNRSLQYCLGVGELGSERSTAIVDSLKEKLETLAPVTLLEDGTVVILVKEFGLLLALQGRSRLTPDRRSLLLTFVEHAALAIKSRETEVELERSRRMAGIGQTVGFLLHDLRHPLGTTKMFLQLVRSRPELFTSVDDALEMMDQEIQRGLDLVGDILSLCRSTIEIHPEFVRLKDALGRILRIWQIELTARKLDFKIDIPDDLKARVDVARLERALSNLVKNSSEAVLSGVKRQIEIGAREVQGGVEIWVADTGNGIPANVLRRLFEPFAISEKPEGMGFGLAIVKQVVDAHDGHVEAKQQDGWTRFTLFFPDAPSPSK